MRFFSVFLTRTCSRPFLDQLHSTKPTARVTYRRWKFKRTTRWFGVGSTSLNRLDYFLSILVRLLNFDAIHDSRNLLTSGVM